MIYRHIKNNQLCIASFRFRTNYLKYSKEIVKNTEDSCFGKSQFLPLHLFCMNFKVLGCIPEVPLLLTPILIYIYACIILYVIYDIHVKFIVIYDIRHIYDGYMYINIVVKRSVWTSGIQPSALKVTNKYF